MQCKVLHICGFIFLAYFPCFAVCSTGRVLHSELALNVAANVDVYWDRLTSTWREYVREQSEAAFKRWTVAREKSDNFAGKVSSQCGQVIEHMIRHPIDQQWSAKMLDSMSTFPAGLLSGTTTELGDFDQCLSIDGTFQERTFVGKYCLATVNLPRTELFKPTPLNRSALSPAWIGDVVEQWYNNDNWYSFASGICFPSICQQEEIRAILQAYYPILQSFEFNVTYCQSREEPQQYHSGIWVAIFILLISIVPVILGTIHEALHDPHTATTPSKVGKILHCYSLISNTKILFRIVDHQHHHHHQHADPPNKGTTGGGESHDSGQFQYIHGIRAINSIYIIFAHTFGLMIVPLLMRVSVYARYPLDMKDTVRTIGAQPIFNGALVVQTFFTMSGMLLTYNALGPKLKIKFWPYVMLRWLRYTPPLIGTICLSMALELLGNGPLFHHDLLWPTLRRCYDSWWLNLLYVNNYQDFDDQCSIQTWYLAAEMQLHIIGFILLLAYLRGPRLAYLASGLLVVLGVILIVIVISSGLTPLSLFHIFTYTEYPVQNMAAKLIYFAPYMQFMSYFLGAIVGQALLEKRTLSLPKPVLTLFNALTLAIFVVYPFSTYWMIYREKMFIAQPTLWQATIYAIYLLLWSLANAWFFYKCSIDHTNVLSRFLSAKVFQPFSRLSFSLYLVHLMTIWYNAHQSRTAISLANLNELYKLISLTLVQSLGLAYLLYLTFEAPSVNLMKLILKQKYKHHLKSEDKQQNGETVQKEEVKKQQ